MKTDRISITRRLVEGDPYYDDDRYLIDLSIRIPYKNFFGKKRYYYKRVFTINENELQQLQVHSKHQILQTLFDLYLKERKTQRMYRVIKNLPQ